MVKEVQITEELAALVEGKPEIVAVGGVAYELPPLTMKDIAQFGGKISRMVQSAVACDVAGMMKHTQDALRAMGVPKDRLDDMTAKEADFAGNAISGMMKTNDPGEAEGDPTDKAEKKPASTD